MPISSGPILLFVESASIVASLVLLLLFIKRKWNMEIPGFQRSFFLIFLGICLSVLGAFGNIINQLFAFAPSTQAAMTNGAQIVYFTGASFTCIGLAFLINLVLPKSTRKLNELVAHRERLAASNDELAKTIATRNQELEISNLTMRQVLQDQQTSRTALQKSEKKFRKLFDESPAIYLTISQLHTITDINLYGAKSLGYDRMSLIGQSVSKIISLEDADKQLEFIDYGFENPAAKLETELRLICDDMRKLWVKVSGSIIDENQSEAYLLLVCQDITESKKLAETLSYQTKHDDLTGLYNRRALEAFLNRKISELSSESKAIALIYIDIDQLKIVNDTCGHKAGDEFIRQMVKQISAYSESFDFFARIGGDEFALVVCEATADSARDVAELVRNAAEDLTYHWENQSFRQSISVGVALTSKSIRNLSDIFAAADAACFAAKQAGRNRVIVHEESSGAFDSNRNEMLWASRLQTALLNERFELYFQPIMKLSDIHGHYVHYEVLLRYVDDDGTHVSPEAFLPAAERFGLSSQIDLWVLTTILDFLDHNPDHTAMLDSCSINLSTLSLANHQSRSAIKQLVMAASYPAEKLCFEITETSAIHNLDEAVIFINELKTLGCKFALDDFGTGFSSFSYLKNLAVDYIKIDGSFIRDITHDKLGKAMVKAMNNIGKELNIATIAEYVENQQIHIELQKMAVPYGQGFGLAKPMPLDKVKEYYALTLRR